MSVDWADPMVLLLVVLGPVVVAGGVAAVLLAVAVVRDPGRSLGPEWTPGWSPEQLERARMVVGVGGGHPVDAARACGLVAPDRVGVGGRHRVDAARACGLVAPDRGHDPRHGFEEVPPCIAYPLGLMSPVDRAQELVRQLGVRSWRPVGPAPRWARRVQLELTARLRAAGVAATLAPRRVGAVLP